ncbi:Protein of unknown function [Paramaledivibacter caminithermalis DSM 15212]|uniref:Uncharacterized protein n=1 Tax=Paramaledivibacter caminithermalis (strain DSM 15212 / CIP 107654 / DViRD3) TaxID=1121301 RepID=A0A1M6M8P2_PARC5|nr:Protein of unknown function [Paramaledivibacter caminithermalis DSM 15212]
MNQGKFISKFKIDLEKEFGAVKIKDNNIFLRIKNTEVCCSLQDVYRDYIISGDYNNVKDRYIELIWDVISKQHYKINLDVIFPVLRPCTFGGDNAGKFYREKFAEDIMIYFVEDKDELWKYLTLKEIEDSGYSVEEIKNKAFQNINKITNSLNVLDENIRIYSLAFDNQLGSSIILSEKFRKQLDKIGKDLLVAIPAQDALLVSKYTYQNRYIMKNLVKVEIEEKYRISNKLYRYKNNKIMLVKDKNVNLQLVK